MTIECYKTTCPLHSNNYGDEGPFCYEDECIENRRGNKMTKLSFEVPIKHLYDFDDLQDYIFSLSMLYTDHNYQEYILHQRQLGLKTIWLDNSYNEKMEADHWKHLTDLAAMYSVSKVIAPDNPKWGSERIKTEWKRMARITGPSHTICVVSSYKMYLDMLRAGVSRFAVSYWTRPDWSIDDLKKIDDIHFLGLLSINELLEVRPASCDTSMPIKLALQGKTLRQWHSEGCPHIHTKDLGVSGAEFFNYQMTASEIELARRNIWELRKAINDQAPS